jgi:hypothetical protein
VSLHDALTLAASVLLSLGGGAVLILALAGWLGKVWAGRLLEDKKASYARDYELMVRRRDVYTKLILGLRVFIDEDAGDEDTRRVKWRQFFAAYDEASVWAPDSVLLPVNQFLKRKRESDKDVLPATRDELRKDFAAIVAAMRRDIGFASTEFEYRFLTF